MTIIVTAAIIRKDDKILIAQRMPDSTNEANKWEFPGGKLKDMEHPEEGLIREIKEELDIEIRIEKLFEVNSHVYGGKGHVILLAFLADYVSGEKKDLEVQDSKWVEPEALKDYDFAAADKPIVERFTK